MKDYSKEYKPEELEPFFPNELLRNLLVIFILIIVEFIGIVSLPESSQDNIRSQEYTPRPLWFLLPIYQLFRIIPSKAACFALLGLAALTLLGLPFWDRSQERRLWKKHVLLEVVIICLVVVTVLGLMGRFL